MTNSIFDVDNLHGIPLKVCHSLTHISDGKDKWLADDVLTFRIEDFRKFGNDLMIGSDLFLCFNKAQAKRLAWLLLRLSTRMKLADQRSNKDEQDKA